MLRFLISIFIVAFVFSTCSFDEESALTDTPNSHLLISAEELNSILDEQVLFLLDARADNNDSVRPYEGSWSENGNRTDAVIQ